MGIEANSSRLSASQIHALDKQYVMGTYIRQPMVFVKGDGARLWDSEGNEYLDFLAGIAVAQVGHCHPRIAEAICKQSHALMHVSNLFHNELQAQLAARLCGLTGMDKVFFCNSGAEANECAIKLARKRGKQLRGPDCYEIITFEGSFHGRTLGALAATAQPKYQEAFAPMPPGFIYTKLNDLTALDNLISERTCAVMVEPIQGESGVRPVAPEFLRAMRALCDEAEVLLILDEVQCGTGRTGCFLGSHRLGVKGDVITMAKGIADGFPMGACLASGEAANTLVPGDHGSTFAGQPLACAAALATLDVLEEEGLLQHAEEVGAFLMEALGGLSRRHPHLIAEVRGMGLMIGVEFARPVAKQVLAGLFSRFMITNAVGDSILRLVPPLVITREQCTQLVEALDAELALISA